MGQRQEERFPQTESPDCGTTLRAVTRRGASHHNHERERTIFWFNERHERFVLLSRIGPDRPAERICIRELMQEYQQATGACVYCD
jgi:hypothetical protein